MLIFSPYRSGHFFKSPIHQQNRVCTIVSVSISILKIILVFSACVDRLCTPLKIIHFLKTESSGFCTIKIFHYCVFEAKIYHKIEKTWERFQADKRTNTSKIRFQSGTWLREKAALEKYLSEGWWGGQANESVWQLNAHLKISTRNSTGGMFAILLFWQSRVVCPRAHHFLQKMCVTRRSISKISHRSVMTGHS